MFTVAIEGPCCAGKTTLGSNLLANQRGRKVVVVPDYSDFAGGGKNLPNPVPGSLKEELAALAVFEDLERRRLEQYVAPGSSPDLVIIDRSVHTLLAHCFAMSAIQGHSLLSVASALLGRSPAPLWPELIIYLDTPEQTINERNRGKFPPDSIFINPFFNKQIRSYFCPGPRFRPPRTVHLNATAEPMGLCSEASSLIARHAT